jgi:phosphoglycolate phosphatase
MKYKGVIFDLDGTLLDSLEDLANCVNQVLKCHGFPSHALEKYRYFVGDGMYNLLLRALPCEQRQDSFIKQCVTEMKGEYARHWADKTRPYQEIPQLLQGLQEKGLKLAVLSNKPDEFAKIVVARFFPGQFVQVVGEGAGIPKKPNPQGALAVAETMQISPRELLYLGDTNTDMQTAVAAGMFPVGVLWGFREAAELEASGAKVLIEKPLDLLQVFPTT